MKIDLSKLRHERSAKDFPDIDLVEGEFVALKIVRSKFGLFMIWAGTILGIIGISFIWMFLISGWGGNTGLMVTLNSTALGYFNMIAVILYVVLLLAGIIGTIIYKSNFLFITNKRAIQKTQISLFASSTNIIELQSIEDVSFRQNGIIDYIVQLGTIRMSTVGDETTYTFPYVDTPRDEIKVITELIHRNKEQLKKPKIIQHSS